MWKQVVKLNFETRSTYTTNVQVDSEQINNWTIKYSHLQKTSNN